jgi:LmbE family N-acetylglucosaminyl deacetylase
MRVLAIVSHPDDEVLGVGGTLLKHKAAGDEVTVVLTHFCRDTSHDESQVAQQRMGVRYDRLYRTEFTVEDAVGLHRPDIVYTHSAADLHHDHLETLQRAVVACRPQSGVRYLYAFETPSATDWSGRLFDPRHFVDISSTIEDKLHAMEAYASELRPQPHPRNVDALAARAEYWGQRSGLLWAEAFEVIRSCA